MSRANAASWSISPAGLPHWSLPDLGSGLCSAHSLHTTAALTVNENADPDVQHDLRAKLHALVPQHESYYRHAEGNSAAHLKSSLMGFSEPCFGCGTAGGISAPGRASTCVNSTGRAPAGVVVTFVEAAR
ncbi:MAG: secondary thiamine-phosphate synthase enzyme YjbQ [Victivallis sp.]